MTLRIFRCKQKKEENREEKREEMIYGKLIKWGFYFN